MRSLLAAVVVTLLAASALVSRSSHARTPPAAEYEVRALIDELSKKKNAPRTGLATVRWYSDVFHGVEISAPKNLDADGAATAAVRPAENLILGRACAPLTGPELAAASKVLAEFDEALPVTLRAYTLGSQGKGQEAAELFMKNALSWAVKKECPGEHPDSSGRRVRAIRFGLQCVKTFDPKRDVKALEEAERKAQECKANNHAVG